MPEKRIEKSLYQFANIRLVCYRESPGLLSRSKALVVLQWVNLSDAVERRGSRHHEREGLDRRQVTSKRIAVAAWGDHIVAVGSMPKNGGGYSFKNRSQAPA
jgi:hypothetical protein